MNKKEAAHDQNKANRLNRRELLSKYGPYTAPLVVSMLVPNEAYSHNTMQVYSTSAACVADASGGSMHGIGMNGHCMINGAAGGMQTHPIINPGPPT